MKIFTVFLQNIIKDVLMNNTSSLQRFHLFIWRYYYAVSAIGTTRMSQYVEGKLIFLYSLCSLHFQFGFFFLKI